MPPTPCQGRAPSVFSGRRTSARPLPLGVEHRGRLRQSRQRGNALGRRTGRTTPSGHTSTWTYDQADRHTSLTTPDPLGLSPAPNPNADVHNPHTWCDPLGLMPDDSTDLRKELMALRQARHQRRHQPSQGRRASPWRVLCWTRPQNR
ncbi:hypothetical protein GR130_05810 [Streptomyces sp. GS7]|nr:hypothetical protein GR130_05810 [Streptomyces sp. GS7]